MLIMMRFALISHKTNKESLSSLEREGFLPILLPDFSRLAEPVSSHADMLTFCIDGKIIMSSEYFSENEALFSPIKSKLVLTDEVHSSNYPNDIIFNALVCNGYIFGRLSSLSRKILSLDYRLADIKQGYAACSCISFANCIITSDPSVTKSAKKLGIEVLQIPFGNIRLDPYDYGFIGGCSGVFGNKIYFNGSLSEYPYGNEIKSFAAAKGFECVSLSLGALTDCGGIKFI